MTSTSDTSATSLATERPVAAASAETLSLVEERARVGKRQVEGERVRVTTRTEVLEEHVRETLRSDEVEVLRVPVNRTLEPGEAAPAVRTEGNLTIVPVLEEIVVVEKRLLLKEEVHILRDATSETVEVPVALRKQRAVVERTGPDGKVIEDSEGA